MKNFIKLNLLFLLIGVIYLEACDSGVQSTGNSIHGNVTFVDSNFARQNGNYEIALYTMQDNPFASKPAVTQIIDINQPKPNQYNISNNGGGNFYLAVVWSSNDNNKLPSVLGVHGCDTTHNCQNFLAIAFPNYTGHNFDMVCWADTTKYLY